MSESAQLSNYLLAGGTIVAALFVAVQAWYARIAYVETSETRFLEKKLDICFENFDQAAAVDAVLRFSAGDMVERSDWPPIIVVSNAAELQRLQQTIVPRLDALEAGLTKASVLGDLDKFRAYLAQQARGLSKEILDINPADFEPEDEVMSAALAKLSEFLGAQYAVFTGCRLVAEGQA